MPQEPPAPFPTLRKFLPYTTAAAVLALIYLAWVFYSRYSTNREIQRAADRKSIEQARKIDEMYGNGRLKILLFYASPPVLSRGESSQLCYSVANAAKVKIDHGVEEIKPSLSRCVPVKPLHSTTYTLTADDDQGNHATQSVDVVIR